MSQLLGFLHETVSLKSSLFTFKLYNHNIGLYQLCVKCKYHREAFNLSVLTHVRLPSSALGLMINVFA